MMNLFTGRTRQIGLAAAGLVVTGLVLTAVMGAGAGWFVPSGREVASCDLPPPDAMGSAPGAGGEQPGPDGMVYVPGGRFTMGAVGFYADEAPLRAQSVDGFWIDRTEVTNRQFAAFVAATGYVTLAERGIEDVVPPGAAVFSFPDEAEKGSWAYAGDANWRHPAGAGSSLNGREDYPVVQIALEDARAYAAWKGRELPTEVQFEYAARGGLEGKTYAWGDEFNPDGQWMANNWQGIFPFFDEGADGFRGLAPVGCFPANGYGAYDLIGNVWEWTSDPYVEGQADVGLIKGGSFLCAANYCGRYRPAARHPQEELLGTDHIGFRTVLRVSSSGDPARN